MLGCGSVRLVYSVIAKHIEFKHYSVHFSIHWRIFWLALGLVFTLLMNTNCIRQVKLDRDDISALRTISGALRSSTRQSVLA